MLHEILEQQEFLRGELHVGAADVHAVAIHVDGEDTVAKDPSWRVPLRAPEQRADPRHELLRAERLRDVVVRPLIEPRDAVRFVASRREHQHGNRRRDRLAAQRLAHRHAVHPRKHEIEDDEIWQRRLRACEHGSPSAHRFGRVAGALKIMRDEIGDVAVVFHDEYAAHELLSRARGHR